jgi:hypothetical protein
MSPLNGSGADVIEPVTLEFDPDLSPRSAYVLFTQLENSSARAALLRGFSAFHAARARADLDGAPNPSTSLSSPLGRQDIAIVAGWQQRPTWLGFDRIRQLVVQKPANPQELEKLKSSLDDLMARLHEEAARPHAQRLLAFVFDLSAKIATASGNIAAIFPTGNDISWTGPFDLVLDSLTLEALLAINPAMPSDPDPSMQLTLRALPLSSELAAVRTWVAGNLSADGGRVVAAALNELATTQLFDGYTFVRLTALRGIAAPQQVQKPAVA